MIKKIAYQLLSCLKIALIAGGVSYLVVERMPVPAQVMIVRTSEVAQGLEKLNSPESQKVMAERMAQMKSIIDQAVTSGVVVVDADAVIGAPSGAYISIASKNEGK